MHYGQVVIIIVAVRPAAGFASLARWLRAGHISAVGGDLRVEKLLLGLSGHLSFYIFTNESCDVLNTNSYTTIIDYYFCE